MMNLETYLSDKYNGLSSLNNLFTDVITNDEFETFLKLYILLYADDTIVMAESSEDLQEALNAVGNYCELWKLRINVNKTKIIRFAKGKRSTNPNNQFDFRLNGEKVEVVDDYVYLGTTVSYNGKYKKAIKKPVTQAKRALLV